MDETEESPPLRKVLKHSTYTTSDSLKQRLDEQVAKFFYACNIPFAVAEDRFFKEFVQALRPGYRPPTRKAIEEMHLKHITEGLRVEKEENLQGKMVATMEEDRSSVHNDSVVDRPIKVEV